MNAGVLKGQKRVSDRLVLELYGWWRAACHGLWEQILGPLRAIAPVAKGRAFTQPITVAVLLSPVCMLPGSNSMEFSKAKMRFSYFLYTGHTVTRMS